MLFSRQGLVNGFGVFLVAVFLAGCASHQYAPVTQSVKTPDKVKKSFTNVSASSLNQHRQAMLLFNQGDYAGAARHWKQALEGGVRDNTFQAEINYNLGVTFLRMGKFILSEQHFRRVLEFDNRDARSLTGLGNALAAQDRLKEAALQYGLALGADPGMAEAYAGIAGISIRTGNYLQAVDSMRAATAGSQDPAIKATLAQTYVVLAESLVAGKNLDGAEELFAMAATLDPQSPQPLFGLGHVLLARGYPGRAEPLYKKARDLAPNYLAQPEDILPLRGARPNTAEAIRAEGMAAYFAERGDYERSVEQYELALTREPTKVETWLALGDIYLNRLNRPDKAADCVHALWMLGISDERTQMLAMHYGEEAPPLEEGAPPTLLWTQAALESAPGAAASEGGANAFKAGRLIYRLASVKVPPGVHKFNYRLIDPSGKTVRDDVFDLDCVTAERRLTAFDTLLIRGVWKQEWWIDGKMAGFLKFDLQ